MSYDSEVLADSPVGYWKLDETSGTTATDSSGNGNDGTYTGTITPGGRTLLSGVNSPDFAGGYVSLGSPSVLNFRDVWTLEAWAITDIGGSGEQYIVTEGYSGGATQVQYSLCKNIGGGGSGKVMAGAYSGSAWTTVSDPTTPPTGVLRHWVATYDGTNLRMYRDGDLVGGPVAMSQPASSFNSVSIGDRVDNTGRLNSVWDGTIGRVAIYHTALSAARVTAHFVAGAPPSTLKVYHEYAEVLAIMQPPVKVYHEYAEVLARTQPPVKVYHEYAEVLSKALLPVAMGFTDMILNDAENIGNLIDIDTFTRSSLGSTEYRGQTWSTLSGTWAIVSNQLKITAIGTALSGSSALLVVDTGFSDFTIELDTVTSTLSSGSGFAFRVVDANNGWLVMNYMSGGGLNGFYLMKIVAGVRTDIYSFVSVAAQACKLKIVCSGNSISVYTDGTLRGSTTDSTHNTATKAGPIMWAGPGVPANTLDNWKLYV